MKIAVLTVTYNDGYKFAEWVKWYEEYKNAVQYHVIIDNGSDLDYLKQVKDVFSNSIILENKTNVGSTGAYNKGIRYILENTDADYIALLGNDIRISSDSLILLAESIEKNPEVGMVAPILFEANSNIIADFGCNISRELTLVPYRSGELFSSNIEAINYCETVTGGANVASRDFYQVVGLQDELLFMYSDEVDMGIRAKREGYKMMALRDAQAWHQHINPNNRSYRKPYSNYLMARNKVYLANKHKMLKAKVHIIILFMKLAMKKKLKAIVLNEKVFNEQALYTIAGLYYGLRNDMKANKYTQYR